MSQNDLVTSHFNMDAHAVLDPAIVAQNTHVDLTAEPNAVFLTGVTGFVGAYLCRDILQKTGADVYCLVRAESRQNAFARIKSNLERYSLWQPEYAQRLIPVKGDLKLPLFGLTPDTFQMLADWIDVIYHCGSKLSYVAPFEYLNAANIGGTQEALRLATRGKAKPLHYVSTLGIFLAYKIPQGGQEDDELDPTKCPDVGYFRTKYVAEKVVRIARDRGIPVTIHRIGLIVGDSQTGLSNVDDFVARMLIGSIEAGYAPDVRTAMDMTPVDFASAAIYYLSRQKASVGQTFHILNPEPIHWSDIFDIVIEAGYPVRKLPFEEWVGAIEKHADPATNPLYPLLPFFHIDFARRMLGVSESHFHALGRAVTQQALAGFGVRCPHIDKNLIGTFLSRMAQSGRLASPSGENISHSLDDHESAAISRATG